MLKNNEIIEKLTTKQKIALLTDAREAEALRREYNIPSMLPCSLQSDVVDRNGEPIFPTFASLANSWDGELFGNVALKIAAMKTNEGNNLFILPKTNSASSVYGSEITEDPYLAGKLFSSMARTLSDAGVTICMQAPTVTSSDIQSMDKTADITALFERVVRPFIMTRNASRVSAYVFTPEEIEQSYKEANEKMVRATIKSDLARITNVSEKENAVAIINSGSQALGATSANIEAAYDNYTRIYHSMEEGGASASELEMAILDGAAINDEIIDLALDQRISLATKQIKELVGRNTENIEDLARESAQKSIALIKNNSAALPLKQGERVCVIGDIIASESGKFVNFESRLSESLGTAGISVIGYERGYELESDISQELVAPALELASKADTVLLFLGLGAKREGQLEKTRRLTLPANQIELASRLKSLGKKVIIAICGSRLPCMRFDRFANGVLLIPTQGKYVSYGLGDILSGRFNPSARLAYAGYNDIDTKYREIQARKQRGSQKIGQFVGYRYTDGADVETKYPFGYGLSYSRCTYENMYLNSTNVVCVTVKNNTNREVFENVQVYFGKNNPKTFKELKGYSQVPLRPFERKTVTINLEETKKYDMDFGNFVADGGSYSIYVGASSRGKHLTRGITLTAPPLEENYSITEYIHEISNIHSESYTMEAHCEPMNNASKLRNFSLWLMAIVIFLDIVYGVCGLIFGLPFKDYLTIFICVNTGVLAFSSILLIIYAIVRHRYQSKQEKQEKIAKEELFKNADIIDADSVEKLFEVEFDSFEEKKQKKRTVTYQGKDEALYVYMEVNTDLATLANEMEAFFENNGLQISIDVARSTLASLMSSRLLVIRDKQIENSIRFIRILSAFLGTMATFESLSDRNWETDTLLFKSSSMTGRAEQGMLASAFNYANTNSERFCFYTMRDVKYKDLERFLMPYVQFMANPKESYTVADNGLKFVIPTNLWFALIASENESIEDMPAFVGNLSSVIDINAQLIRKAEEIPFNSKPITNNQMEALTYRSKKGTTIDENQWKLVDLLEEQVNQQTPYHIGNKLFLHLEGYMSIYLTSGGELANAMDSMVANKLLPSIMSMLSSKTTSELDLLQTLESIFGEENVSKCASLVKYPSISLMKNQSKPSVDEKKAEPSDKEIKAASVAVADQNEMAEKEGVTKDE